MSRLQNPIFAGSIACSWLWLACANCFVLCVDVFYTGTVIHPRSEFCDSAGQVSVRSRLILGRHPVRISECFLATLAEDFVVFLTLLRQI
jgi:hypothetical protein